MTDDFSNEIPAQPLISRFTLVLIVAAAGLFFAWMLRELQPPPLPVDAAAQSEFVGQVFPELNVEGWLNGPAPTADELEGKVRVFEAWAFWCGPCLAIAPHMVEMHNRYADRGVVFIGLTSEGSDQLELSRKFLQRAKNTWPNAYGAGHTLTHFYPDSMSIPLMWVVDKQGKIAYHGHPLDMPKGLLDDLLK